MTRRGFTLVELMVVVGIVMLIAGGAIANFNRYHDDQKVRQAGATIKNHLRLAQQQAVSGKKPAGGCSSLAGYQVTVAATGYAIQAACSEGLVGDAQNVNLPAGVMASAVPASPIVFRVLGGGIDTPVTITISGVSLGMRISVSANGDITDEGTFRP